MNEDISTDTCFGVSKSMLLDLCCSSPFPGTMKWPAEHPIWDCHVAGKPSPREAWTSIECLQKAIDNLYWILNKCANGTHHSYPSFIDNHRRAFAQVGFPMLEKVLNRFTIAKIAPKVTALPESLFYKEIERAGIDLSSGIYCPMAGFGGIVRAGRQWLVNHGISGDLVYAADINPNLCSWYGWTQQDLLAQVVSTDMTVCVCPPFGKNTERWHGTPDCMYLNFEEWVRLICEHVRAKQYAFFGPSLTDKNTSKACVGLFGRKQQARLYSNDEIQKILLTSDKINDNIRRIATQTSKEQDNE